MTTRVWICQCLCPQRHCILATAGEAPSRGAAEESIEQPLREHVAAMLAGGAINPWCSLCKSEVGTWQYELARTAFRSMEEAAPKLRQSVREQAAMRAIWGDLPRSD